MCETSYLRDTSLFRVQNSSVPSYYVFSSEKAVFKIKIGRNNFLRMYVIKLFFH